MTLKKGFSYPPNHKNILFINIFNNFTLFSSSIHVEIIFGTLRNSQPYSLQRIHNIPTPFTNLHTLLAVIRNAVFIDSLPISGL